MDFTEVGWGEGGCSGFIWFRTEASDRFFLNTTVNLSVPQDVWNFLTGQGSAGFPGRTE